MVKAAAANTSPEVPPKFWKTTKTDVSKRQRV